MELQLHWHKSILLKKGLRDDGIYHIDFESLPEVPGVYIFFRQYGRSQEALYVGKAGVIRQRIRQQFNNLRLMKGIENAAIGRKLLVVGEFIPRRGQQAERALPILERNLIRHFLMQGDQLINVQGTRMSTGTIVSTRSELKAFIPKDLHFEG